MSEKKQVKVYLPQEQYEMLSRRQESNSEIVESALWAEFGGRKKEALERRIEELDNRITSTLTEKNEREREIEKYKDEKETLLNKLEEIEEQETELMQDVRKKLENVPLEPDNPGVQAQAKRVEMEPEELIKEVKGDVDR